MSGTLSVLAMTVDRLVATNWPLHAATFCRPRRAVIVLSIGLPMIIAFNIPYYYRTDIVVFRKIAHCFTFVVHDNLVNVYVGLNIIINCLLPFIALLIMNSAIFLAVRRSRKPLLNKCRGPLRSSSLTATTSMTAINPDSNRTASSSQISIVSQSATDAPEDDSASKKVSQRDNKLAIMLAVVTLSFLALTLPQYVRFIVFHFVRQPKSHYMQEVLGFLYNIAHKLFYMNNAVNFYIYCLTGTRFRKDLKELLHLPHCKTSGNN